MRTGFSPISLAIWFQLLTFGSSRASSRPLESPVFCLLHARVQTLRFLYSRLLLPGLLSGSPILFGKMFSDSCRISHGLWNLCNKLYSKIVIGRGLYNHGKKSCRKCRNSIYSYPFNDSTTLSSRPFL